MVTFTYIENLAESCLAAELNVAETMVFLHSAGNLEVPRTSSPSSSWDFQISKVFRIGSGFDQGPWREASGPGSGTAAA
jgi:hypothetical protein